MAIKKTIIKKMFTILWLAVGMGTILLLVAAINKKDAQLCTGVNITIEGVDNNFFVDKKDILNSITSIVGGNPAGEVISAFDLKKLEIDLQKDIWIKTAQLFFDNNNRLRVRVFEREPMARVFTKSGNTFYIDSSLAMLPLSEKFSARLPVFTGFPSDKIILAKADSGLLKDILKISLAIQKDTFNTAIIDQVDITPQRSFELIPKIGNTIIVFGDATDVEEKFNKLKLFYRQVMVKAGWSKYSVLNMQYKGQVVAKRKGAEDKSIDSLRTLQLMQFIAENAERQSNDSMHMIVQDNENNSTDFNLVQQSIERGGEMPQALNIPGVVLPVENKQAVISKPAAVTNVKPSVSSVKKIAPSRPLKVIVKPKLEVAKKVIKVPLFNKVKPKALLPKQIVKPGKKAEIKSLSNEY